MQYFSYVYMLQTLTDLERHYVGLTDDPPVRLRMHNNDSAPHTAKYQPWKTKTPSPSPTVPAPPPSTLPEIRLRQRLRPNVLLNALHPAASTSADNVLAARNPKPQSLTLYFLYVAHDGLTGTRMLEPRVARVAQAVEGQWVGPAPPAVSAAGVGLWPFWGEPGLHDENVELVRKLRGPPVVPLHELGRAWKERG